MDLSLLSFKTDYPVLDHGYVKLIDYMGTDQSIIEAARMSTGRGFEGWEAGQICKHCRIRKEEAASQGSIICFDLMKKVALERDANHVWENTKGDAHLLEFLYKNRHHTPFEMGQLVIEVQAPIMVFREWMRHRTQSYNEMSARYIQMPNLHYLPDPSRIQRQSATNKQGSEEPLDEIEAKEIIRVLSGEQQDVYNYYDLLVDNGVAKEVARINTPVSRYSRMRASANLRNWLGFLALRWPKTSQWEIRQYANIVAEIFGNLWPRTYSLFEEYTLHSTTFSRTALQKLADRLGMPVDEVRKLAA